MRRFALALALLAGLACAAIAAAPDAPRPATGNHFVFLVRHGAFDRNDGLSELTDNPLNALGHEQARRLGERLADMNVPFTRFATSDFLRARQTAEDIGAVLHRHPDVDTLIRECTPTPEHPEYTTYHSPEDIAHCVESLEAVWSRYFAPTPQGDTWDLLVCHGNVIRWLVARATGADERHWYANDIANASLTVIAIRPDGSMRLVTYSDVGHLPPALQKWAGRGWGSRAPTRRTR